MRALSPGFSLRAVDDCLVGVGDVFPARLLSRAMFPIKCFSQKKRGKSPLRKRSPELCIRKRYLCLDSQGHSQLLDT